MSRHLSKEHLTGKRTSRSELGKSRGTREAGPFIQLGCGVSGARGNSGRRIATGDPGGQLQLKLICRYIIIIDHFDLAVLLPLSFEVSDAKGAQ
jgi:hypothetical protein